MKFITAAILLLAFAQQAQRFEVVSVKPCDPSVATPGRAGGAGGNGSSPGSLALNCVRPVNLVYMAYVVNGGQAPGDPIKMWAGSNIGTQFTSPGGEPQRVRGGPDWAYQDRFTIEAKPAGPTDAATMQGVMLRAVLEERFHLKVHQTTEDVPMWALTVSSGGAKLKPPVPGDCVTLDPGQPVTRDVFLSHPGKAFCGRRTGSESNQTRTWRFGGQSIGQLADTIALDLGVKVIDRTGLSGVFNFVLEYALDDDTTDNGRPRTVPARPSSAPSVFSAVQEQLGLKLTRIKGPRGFIMIDQIEKPSPNIPISEWLSSLGRSFASQFWVHP